MTAEFVRSLFEKNLLLNPVTKVMAAHTTAQAIRYATSVTKVLNQTLEQAVDSGFVVENGFVEELLQPLMNRTFMLCADASKASQTALNEVWGYGLKAQMPQSGYKINDILELAEQTAPENMLRAIKNPIDAFGRQVIADGSRKHVELLSRSGVTMVANRINDDVGLHGGKDRCEYCDRWAGEWVYPNIPDEVWGFHPGCGCTLLYTRKDGQTEYIR